MPPVRRGAPVRRIFLAAAALALFATPVHAFRVVNYNLHDYPGTTGATRDPLFRAILSPLAPDVVAVQEMQSQTGVNEFLSSVLNTLEPGQWAAAPFVNGNDTDNALFYKPSKVQFLGGWSFYPNPATNLRLVSCYRLKPVGYGAAAAELRIYSQHLKASQGFENDRLQEAIGIRDTMNAMPPGTHAILLGDFNIYTGTEPAYAKFLENQADNDGRLYDPLGLGGITWQDNASIALYHTQCPCKATSVGGHCPGGFSGGGLDDRFDMFLPTLNLGGAEGLALLPGTYISVGQDGLHLNKEIIDSPTIPEGATYASALLNASDHLPVRVDLQLPARIDVASSLALGTVIVGGGANLSVLNSATLPADELNYSFSAPAGFGAPAGSFTLNAGAPAALHAITTAAGPAGSRAGDLVITTDDPDNPAKLVSLTATVLDHANASLDSAASLASGVVDFGVHPNGGFSNQTIRVHNLGYDALQARLSLNGAAIAGGDGRFSLPGGFSPVLIAGVGQSYDLAFDDAGATPDSTYEATLTFTSADEPLPGATPRPDLTVSLQARVESGALDAGTTTAPGVTRLYPPFPNPLVGQTSVRFDLARRTGARLEVFDLTGRRVASLADRAFEPGRYTVRWDGRGSDGLVAGPGLYFIRLTGAGIRTEAARLIVLR